MSSPIAAPPPIAALTVRTIEQLNTLKAVQTLPRFTFGKLAAVAGVRAQTIRCMLGRWADDGFLLLKQVDVEHGAGAGQPSKVNVLAPEMKSIVAEAIKAADSLQTARAATATATEITEALERMNALDTAVEMIDAAESEADAEGREMLAKEADELLRHCRSILQRKDIVASVSLYRNLMQAADRLETVYATIDAEHAADGAAAFQSPGAMLASRVEEDAAQLRRRAGSMDAARAMADLSDWAKLFFTSATAISDAAVGFFGGFMVARGQMGENQDTLLDQWFSHVAAMNRDALETGQLSLELLQKGFVASFERMIECSRGDDTWLPLLQQALIGITKNARLAVVPELQQNIGQLVRSTSSNELRAIGQQFLQQYATDANLVQEAAGGGAAASPSIDPYFATRTHGPARSASGGSSVAAHRELPKSADLIGLWLAAFAGGVGAPARAP